MKQAINEVKRMQQLAGLINEATIKLGDDELTPSQKQWAIGEMKDIERDLRKDDTGLEDLDEGIKNVIGKIKNFLVKKGIIKPTAEEVVIIEYTKLLKWVRDNVYDLLDHGEKKYNVVINYANKVGIDIDRKEAFSIIQAALSDEIEDLD